MLACMWLELHELHVGMQTLLRSYLPGGDLMTHLMRKDFHVRCFG